MTYTFERLTVTLVGSSEMDTESVIARLKNAGITIIGDSMNENSRNPSDSRGSDITNRSLTARHGTISFNGQMTYDSLEREIRARMENEDSVEYTSALVEQTGVTHSEQYVEAA